MPKFSPGDPVWLRAINIPGYQPNHIAPGEYSAVISPCTAPYWVEPYGVGPIYVLDVQAFDLCIAREEFIRPRRDDYQQHEKLGSMNEVFTPKLDERSLELACEAMKEAKEDAMARGRMKAARFALMYGAAPNTIRRMFKRAP